MNTVVSSKISSKGQSRESLSEKLPFRSAEFLLLVNTMLLLFSFVRRLSLRLKNILVFSLSNSQCPTSSIIRNGNGDQLIDCPSFCSQLSGKRKSVIQFGHLDEVGFLCMRRGVSVGFEERVSGRLFFPACAEMFPGISKGSAPGVGFLCESEVFSD